MNFNDLFTEQYAPESTVNNTEQTVSGMINGVSYLADYPHKLVIVSLNLPPKSLPRLQQALRRADPSVPSPLVQSHERGFCISGIPLEKMTGKEFFHFLSTAIKEALAIQSTFFNDKHEHYGESPAHYFTGLLGALIGAAIGTIPWIIVSEFFDFQFGFLGFLISIASFFGYQLFRGAHSTRFAMTSIIVFTMLAMLTVTLVPYISDLVADNPDFVFPGTILEAFSDSDFLKYLLEDLVFGMVTAGLGLYYIRDKVLAYTHSSQYLRRRK